MECQVWLVRRSVLLFSAAILLATVPGCGSSGAAKTQKVSGKVTNSDGSPGKGLSVGFTGVGSKAFQASGVTADDGSYQLSTFDTNDGAPEGEYAVAITDASGQMTIVEGDAKATVKSGSNTFNFKVQGGAPAAAPPATP